MPLWPVTLPQSPLADSFRETAPGTTIRTQMEQGPAKIRRRTTAGVGDISFAYVLSAAQVAALEGFYLDDLSGGALSFSFTHPRTGGSLSCRFREPPQYASLSGDYFRAAVKLEILP